MEEIRPHLLRLPLPLPPPRPLVVLPAPPPLRQVGVEAAAEPVPGPEKDVQVPCYFDDVDVPLSNKLCLRKV